MCRDSLWAYTGSEPPLGFVPARHPANYLVLSLEASVWTWIRAQSLILCLNQPGAPWTSLDGVALLVPQSGSQDLDVGLGLGSDVGSVGLLLACPRTPW